MFSVAYYGLYIRTLETGEASTSDDHGRLRNPTCQSTTITLQITNCDSLRPCLSKSQHFPPLQKKDTRDAFGNLRNVDFCVQGRVFLHALMDGGG